MSTILFKEKEGVGFISLNRPSVFNSFNREMALELQNLLDHCHTSVSIRSLLITGAGKAFSAGQDLQEVTGPNAPELSTILSEHYNPIITRLRDIKKPIVAAVNGVAAGAGANIALACDIVVAAESATFIQAFSKIGLIPDSGGTFFLPRLIGLQKATALMMLGEKVSAQEAEKMGMIFRVFPDNTFEQESWDLALLLAGMPTKGLGLIKCALQASAKNDLRSQLALEEELQTQAGQSHDFEEGVKAFLEKRKPVYKGH